MFRDDEAAREERIAALEREAARAQRLAERVNELEAENRELRAELARVVAEARIPPGSAAEVRIDGDAAEYLTRIVGVARTHASRGETVDEEAIADGARTLAAKAGRRYVVPADLIGAAADVLPTRVLLLVMQDVTEGRGFP